MRKAALALLVAGAAGCGGAGGNPNFDLSSISPPDLAAPIDLAKNVYPTGPYGADVGDVFPPLIWEGYVDSTGDEVATKEPYGPYTMNDVRSSGRAYAMIHVADLI